MAARLRRIGRRLTPFVFNRKTWLIAVTAGFVIALGWAWVTQAHQSILCQGPQIGENFKGYEGGYKGYIEITLEGRHPTEPSFKGGLFFVYSDASKKTVSSVTVMRSGARGYGNSQQIVETVWDQERFLGLRPRIGRPLPFDVISLSGLHQYFPFDSATFDFTLDTVPRLNQLLLRLVNRVPGFVLSCNAFRVLPNVEGPLQVSFELRRSPLIQLFVVVLSLALIVFLVLILQIKDTRALPTAVATYFFSALTLRTIVGDQIKMFPTLFDCFILSVCMAMIVSLLWIVHRPTKADAAAETKGLDKQKGTKKSS